ncbi:DUF6308 family protein [Micromonospora sp. NPDC048169]|uniref:DUF6308 family protein n=1 Tax=unclassified Micromonospora TaxID=2617518 RepID=UPI0033FDEF25
MNQPLTLHEILAVLNAPASVDDLRRYFHSAGESAFTGGQFDVLGGGGSRPEVAYVVTAEDVVAVELLGVCIPARQRLNLLRGQLGREVTAQLVDIPNDVELGNAAALQYIVDAGAASSLWNRLCAADGIGWVTAGKLLARKRPSLVPVYDTVVSCAYGTRTGFWRWLHGKLGEEGGVLREKLDTLRRDAELPALVSRLRVLDVVFWMRHRSDHVPGDCSGLRTPDPV